MPKTLQVLLLVLFLICALVIIVSAVSAFVLAGLNYYNCLFAALGVLLFVLCVMKLVPVLRTPPPTEAAPVAKIRSKRTDYIILFFLVQLVAVCAYNFGAALGLVVCLVLWIAASVLLLAFLGALVSAAEMAGLSWPKLAPATVLAACPFLFLEGVAFQLVVRGQTLRGVAVALVPIVSLAVIVLIDLRVHRAIKERSEEESS